jgi:hypothetical protein
MGGWRSKQIRAIRVVEEDKVESALLRNGLRDEEVFLAQLHRRSRLLNQVPSSLSLTPEQSQPSILPSKFHLILRQASCLFPFLPSLQWQPIGGCIS